MNALPVRRRYVPGHRTICPACKAEAKEVWAVVGPNCWRLLPRDVRYRVTLLRKGTPQEEHTGAIRACLDWLREHKQQEVA
jgi:hypothetical protein